MSSPLVSIIIPTKNRCALLQETLASIRQQTYPHWEAVVVDDSSSDGTADMLANLTVAEPKIRFIPRTGNVAGANVCRNQGVTASIGHYIIFLDSDDLLAPFCLAQRVNVMIEKPDLDFAVFPCEVFKKTPGDVGLYYNIETNEQDLDRFLRLDNPWQIHHPIWHRPALLRVGPWDESLPSWQDWDFHLRAIINGLRYQKFPSRDCYWRITESERKSIGAEYYRNPSHLRAAEALFSEVIAMLKDHNLFSLTRRRLMAGLYFAISDLWWGCDRHPHNAKRLWAVCRKQGLIGLAEYYESLLYLSRPQFTGSWRLHHCLERRLPQRYAIFGAPKTVMKTPVNLHISSSHLPTSRT